MNSTALQHQDGRLHAAAVRWYGTFDRALEVAGIAREPPARTWTRSRVLAALRVREREGRSLHFADMAREDSTLYQATRTHLGGAAVVYPLFGITPRQTRWTRELVVAELRRLRLSGAHVSSATVPARLTRAGLRFFGSFPAALRAAGIEPRRRTAWTRELVVAELQWIRAGNKRRVSAASLWCAMRDRFGSARSAWRAAGFEPPPRGTGVAAGYSR